MFPFRASITNRTRYRKHFWCLSTFRTKNIHIYLVCCCQLTLATFPFEQVLRAACVLWKTFWCFSTFITKNIHIYLVCCCQLTLATFPFEQVLRAACVLWKTFWCFSTFITKNIHIYLVCCYQRTLATINVPVSSKYYELHAFYRKHSGVFPHLERRITNRIRLHSKDVYC